MTVTASAPGKVVLLGEYAVLDGAPALVLAVDRRARVTLRHAPAPGSWCTIDAQSLEISAAACRLDGAGRIEWGCDQATSARLGLVATVLAEVAAAGPPPPAFHAVLDTDAFFDQRRAKLGLGSSAALTVALGAALRSMAGQPSLRAEELIAAHRRQQDGRGSGLDIAAAQYGGALIYQLAGMEPVATPVTLPGQLSWCCVWTGRPAATGPRLLQMARWREHDPGGYDSLMGGLTQTAAAGAAAARARDAAGLIAAVSSYGAQLAELGAASGTDIVTREHREIAALARASGVAYKSSGAGGGDIGIAVSGDAGRLSDFRGRIEPAGYRVLHLGVDPVGLAVHTDNEQHTSNIGNTYHASSK